MTTKRRKTYPRTRHDLVAQFCAGREPVPLKGREKLPAQAKATPVAELPLIVRRSQWVRFADRHFFLRKEGLFRFWDWGLTTWLDSSQCPKVAKGSRPQHSSVIVFRDDILALLSAVATLTVHGPRHNGVPYEEQLSVAKSGLLSMTCGTASAFTRRLLNSLGWRTRAFGPMRVEGEYNTHDNGHAVFEFYWPKLRKWVVADIDMCQMFLKNGEYLSLGEVSCLIQDGEDFDLEPLTVSGMPRIDSSPAVAGEFPGFECFQNYNSPRAAKEWLRRTLAVPASWEQGKSEMYFFCDDPAGRARIAAHRDNPRFIPLDRDEWMERFYGDRDGGPSLRARRRPVGIQRPDACVVEQP